MRKHIYEQIELRIKWMDQECYHAGSCKICGCETTALQMCSRACDKPCYPPMMDKYQWELFKKYHQISFDNDKTIWMMDRRYNKPLLYIKQYNDEYIHKF